ncbi:hypothetical protein AYI68_g8170 [Smittium mucronatum]|uniref:Uncharacterized protein n=1 Tax=Smittium mucronatum TaxID=133383 RepID=A0A1R0GLM6_9FUNG|nr:hypothetical protein AYI68_g8170 [Smittium mucronatum]
MAIQIFPQAIGMEVAYAFSHLGERKLGPTKYRSVLISSQLEPKKILLPGFGPELDGYGLSLPPLSKFLCLIQPTLTLITPNNKSARNEKSAYDNYNTELVIPTMFSSFVEFGSVPLIITPGDNPQWAICLRKISNTYLILSYN